MKTWSVYWLSQTARGPLLCWYLISLSVVISMVQTCIFLVHKKKEKKSPNRHIEVIVVCWHWCTWYLLIQMSPHARHVNHRPVTYRASISPVKKEQHVTCRSKSLSLSSTSKDESNPFLHTQTPATLKNRYWKEIYVKLIHLKLIKSSLTNKKNDTSRCFTCFGELEIQFKMSQKQPAQEFEKVVITRTGHLMS